MTRKQALWNTVTKRLHKLLTDPREKSPVVISFARPTRCAQFLDKEGSALQGNTKDESGTTFNHCFYVGKKNIDPIVPEQRTGKAIDATGSLTLNDENEAKAFFGVVKNRLQNVNEWAELSGNLSATFQLVNADGIEVTRTLQQGDYLKIDIPGPGSKTGDGYDWVEIEDVEDKSASVSETFSFRVRPTENPQNKKQNQSKDIAHFYSQESTSTFTVSRKGCNVEASIRDRNTKPNKAANSPVDKIRDSIVGTMGVLSFSKIQWQSLVDGLLSR